MIWLMLACSQAPPPELPVRPVRTLEVTRSGGALEGKFTGTSRSGSEATLSFRSAGTIEAIEVAAGDMVEAGQELARLDASDLRLQLQQSAASVAQADASAQLAQRQLERVEELYVNDNASAADVDAAKAQARGAQASLVASVRQRELAQRALDSARLVASRPGRIGSVIAKERENVGSGTPILVLTPDEALQVTVMVPAGWIERMHAGDEAIVRFPEVAKKVSGQVTEVGGTSQTAGSYPITVKLDEQNEQLRTGMVAEVELELAATGEGRIEVPLSAIGSDGKDRYVWVVSGTPPLVSKKAVETGDLTADGMVVSGIDEGEVLVTAGLSQLYEGREVKLEAP